MIGGGAAAAASAFMHGSMTLLGISPAERSLRPVAAAIVTRTIPIGATATIAQKSQTVSAPGTVLQIDGPADAAERLPVNTAEQLRENLGPLVELNEDAADAVVAVIAARQRAKAAKDFGLADRFRDALKDLGIVLTDVKKDHVSWTVVGG
jgi:cysteinyl-tRNA synthetase